MIKIDLKRYFENQDVCINLKDFTKYSVQGLEEFSVPFDPLIGKWISKEDIDTDENEINENNDYFGDSTEGIFMTGAYCGKAAITITKKETSEERDKIIYIDSRFENISYSDLVEMLECDEMKKEWKEHKEKANNLEVEVSAGMKLYYMPTLYEVYVRHRIRQVLNPPWELCSVSESKIVCENGTTHGKKIEGEKGEFKYAVDVYLQGEVIPDIVLKKNNAEEYIIFDVKYKTGKTNAGTRSDRLQIIAYAYMWNCKRIGHVFPNSSSDVLKIDNISGNCSVDYVELMCNTSPQDGFKERLCEYLK